MHDSEKTNIVFLDMDGVVNCRNFIFDYMEKNGSSEESRETFNELYFIHDGMKGFIVPELLERLKKLCEETNAKIVWSSSWRSQFTKNGKDYDMAGIEKLWKAKGLPFERFLDCTESIANFRFSYVPRYVEISKWIEEHEDSINRIAILDDDYDAWYGSNKHENVFFFQTLSDYGLTEDITEEAKEWLKGEGK